MASCSVGSRLTMARRAPRRLAWAGNPEHKGNRSRSLTLSRLAPLLAVAGVKRLGLAERITRIMPSEEILPAVAQGAIGIESRDDDPRVRGYLDAINDWPTTVCVTAERALMAALEGSCRTPMAALAELGEGGVLALRALIIRPDGSECLTAARHGAATEAAALGADAGAELRRRAGPGFFDLPLIEEKPV